MTDKKIEYLKISENDLRKLLEGKSGDYTFHYYTDDGMEIEIEKGDVDDILVFED